MGITFNSIACAAKWRPPSPPKNLINYKLLLNNRSVALVLPTFFPTNRLQKGLGPSTTLALSAIASWTLAAILAHSV